MSKSIFIAEKPSVAREFAKALKLNAKNKDGYMEGENTIITWCVGHLVTMSYPDAYDDSLKRWSLDTIPFIPETFKYEVIESVKKQFAVVSSLLTREDVSTIYVCTDSGREGEYIYRLVETQAHVTGKERKRVWIDSQTEEEIRRGIKEAKDLSCYDNLCASAYLRAKEDYLMGINFSRALTLKYGFSIKNYLKQDKNVVVSVGRVMTCVLGMVVNREREIRSFVKTPFYRVMAGLSLEGKAFEAEWKSVEGSAYFQSPMLYKENGFKEKQNAEELIELCREGTMEIFSVEKKKETKNPPLLYNLAELQNDCSKYFKISPDETLRIVQELYEKKMVTYPRTDARVLSTAVSKEIYKNISGLKNHFLVGGFAEEVLRMESYKKIAKTRYVNDKQITDHYAIIPTGQGLNNLNGLAPTAVKVYEIIARRFLGIFYKPASYQKVSLVTVNHTNNMPEKFFTSFKVLAEEGYLKVMEFSFGKKKESEKETAEKNKSGEEEDIKCDASFLEAVTKLKKGMTVEVNEYFVKEGETSPPKRYNSGSLILAMENAGQLIEDEELRAQIKGSGIGTSATRAEILKKLVNNQYLKLAKKTQIVTPTKLGEMIYEVVNAAIRPLLDPKLTASWEKGLTMVADGTITEEEYMKKLDDFVRRRTNYVKELSNQGALYRQFEQVSKAYEK